MHASGELPSILTRAGKVGRLAFVFAGKDRTHCTFEVSGLQQEGERSLLPKQPRDSRRHRCKSSRPVSLHRKNPHQDKLQHLVFLRRKPDSLESDLDGKVEVFDISTLKGKLGDFFYRLKVFIGTKLD